ncbi:nucleolar protein 16 [Sitophilus oryzae]|uniref:Nucleolar protein 16 n=1 Tax=Sitophilus oryzae TaxID=7048 RepID=A0A6J2Y984_SITOR|nr:nucleolar protein 16 [Sitophilus oryzae]
MPRLRKQRRRKTYKHNINRKRLRNKIEGVGNISCKEIKNAWDKKKSVQSNLEEMGLSYDPNKTIEIPKRKKQLKEALGASEGTEWKAEEIKQNSKNYVVKALESEAKAPREKRFQLPKGQVEWITYLLRKYGKDYKAMARDRKNYYQETWKQLRQKIRTFKKIPVQYNKYLQENGLTASDTEEPEISDDEL